MNSSTHAFAEASSSVMISRKNDALNKMLIPGDIFCPRYEGHINFVGGRGSLDNPEFSNDN